jgi:hypothetical protein
LTGFTDDLLILGTGSHVKPNVRVQGQSNKPLQKAVDALARIGLTGTDPLDIVTLMDSKTAKTPYGTLVDFESALFQPFKGVQHGMECHIFMSYYYFK